MRIQTVNPATGLIIDSYETQTRGEALADAGRVHAAFPAWRDTPLDKRAALLTGLAVLLRSEAEEHAATITLEMGKPLREARAEVEKCAWLCEVYAESGPAWLGEEAVEADGHRHLVTCEPLGTVLAIMPWNFPFWQALRFAVPALLAGNTCLLKHASNVPRCARAIGELFPRAGFPEDVFRTLFADHETVASLVAGREVQGVSLTGSTEAGRRIAELAGRHLKKVVLELGGSAPFIVLEDADPDFAAENAVLGRLLCTGQSCIAAKRFIVVEAVAEAFTEALVRRMAAVRPGDPFDEKSGTGPLVSREGLDELRSQLDDALSAGASLLAGGQTPSGDGFFMEPTVLGGVTGTMRIAREEVFGPIAPAIVVADEEEALAVANRSEFGLGGSVWTRDLERGLRMARRIEAGAVFVNSIVKSDPRMPFGGIKASGIGRELSRQGLREFVNVKGISLYEHP